MTEAKLIEIYQDFVTKTRVTDYVLKAMRFGWYNFD